MQQEVEESTSVTAPLERNSDIACTHSGAGEIGRRASCQGRALSLLGSVKRSSQKVRERLAAPTLHDSHHDPGA